VGVVVDCGCRLHHSKLPAYMREMKKYHLAHHYKNFDLGFGVTSTFCLIIKLVLKTLFLTFECDFFL
jgi:hypothetical protein